jgi:hypothetical protein
MLLIKGKDFRMLSIGHRNDQLTGMRETLHAEIQQEERKNKKPTKLDGILQESNQEEEMKRISNVILEEMKRMSNVVQGVSNPGCWNTRQYNARLHKMNQEEERMNKLPTQLDGVQGVSNQG